jgi:hypothetical protein
MGSQYTSDQDTSDQVTGAAAIVGAVAGIGAGLLALGVFHDVTAAFGAGILAWSILFTWS